MSQWEEYYLQTAVFEGHSGLGKYEIDSCSLGKALSCNIVLWLELYKI